MIAPTTRETADHAELARRFHDTYERLAPSFGYETRADTKAFDPESPNGRLMTAVCNEVEAALLSEIAALRGERDTWKAMAENGAGGIIAHINRATQAERQRDELRKALERIAYTPDGEDGLSLNEGVDLARQALANQGADQ